MSGGVLSFWFNGGYCCDGRLLFIPCKDVGQVGYLCVDGLGIPWGFEVLPDGDTKYWFGCKEFSWVFERYVDHIGKVFLSLFKDFERGGKTKYIWRMRIEFGNYVRATIQFDFCAKAYYFFQVSVQGFKNFVWMPLYAVPEAQLAKIYLMVK